MKKLIFTSILLALFFTGTNLMAQQKQDDYLGLPGDNLNLYAVMQLFQQSKTLEEFERNLNDQKSSINNLDLNGDGLVDYIKVFDDVDGDVHNIVLQVAVNSRENQDVAVFSVQRFQNGQVQIQLTGDEELYGKNYIIEPNYDEANSGETPNPGYAGNTRIVNGQTVTYINTTPASWPLVRYIYLPNYSVWHSSWYWGYYPTYWQPWHSYSWNYYYGYHYNWYHDYYGRYHQSDYHRYSRWNDFYYSGRRSYSPDVRHQVQSGNYKSTYSHPEDRRNGEAMFAKTHPDQNRRPASFSSGNSSNSIRSSSTTITHKSGINQPAGNNTGISRRPSAPVTSRPATIPSSNTNTVVTHKSDTRMTEKSTVNPAPERNTVTTRRPVNTVSDKSMGNPHSGQNADMKRTSPQPKKNVNSSAKGNNKNNKSETTVKKDDKKKDSDNKDSGHRR